MTRIAILTFVFACALHAEVVVIKNARVIDGTGSPAHLANLVIHDARIDAINDPGAPIPPGAHIIDAAGKTLLPGLFDLHTHLSSSAATGLSADWGKNLKAYLAAGVTTVNDFSAYGEMFEPQRRLLASGRMPGPHVRLASRLSTPGGHGTESGWGDFFTLTASTAEEAHAQMKKILPYKPDVIKIFTDGWRYGLLPDLSSMNQETIAAIVADAHAAGIRVFTHTVTLRGAKIAARAGVDALAHGIGDAAVDQELIDILKEKRTFYIPTMSVFEPHHGSPAPRALPLIEPELFALVNMHGAAVAEAEAPSARNIRWMYLNENVRRLHEAGVPVACGTDAGMAGTFHGYSTLHELELLVKAGIKPMDAIVAGTLTSARAAGLDVDRGTIAPGKLADLLLVDGNPDKNIDDIEKAAKVFLEGKEIDLKALQTAIATHELTPLPSHPVSALVDDMRNPDRTSLQTLRVDATDTGPDHSRLTFLPIVREGVTDSGNDHVLMLEADLAPKRHPHARLDLPLTPGEIELADLSGYQGVTFVARGDCQCQLVFNSYGIRDQGFFGASFEVTGSWKTLNVPFTILKSPNPHDKWDSHSVRSLNFDLSGSPGRKVWLQLELVKFY